MLSRFHTIPERDGQTDKRTDKMLSRYRASLCWHAIKYHVANGCMQCASWTLQKTYRKHEVRSFFHWFHSHNISNKYDKFDHVVVVCVAYTEDFNHLRRVATFAWLPRFLTDATRPLEMARDGFFYTGRRRVRCFWCGVEVPLDVHGLSPQQQHDALSPNCLPAGQLHGHPLSEELLRDVLFWMPMGVEIRRPGVSHQDLNINLR